MTLSNIETIDCHKLRSLSLSTGLPLSLSLPMMALILAALLPIAGLAQEQRVDSSDIGSTPSLINQPRFISDVLYVPLRSGASTGHRVVHKGLKSGSKITLLEENDNGWARIKTSKGTEGWIQKRYLLVQPTASIQLANAQAQIKKITSKAGPLSEKLPL